MTQVVLKLSQPHLQAVEDTRESTRPVATFQAPTREMVILACILAVLQISDGILTGIGMSQFGISAEGNVFLRFLMHHFGYVTTLIVTKSFAILVIGALCYLSSVVEWIPRAMKAVIAVYVFAAVLPWTLILYDTLL